jgi:hypothetical protein
MQMHVIGITDAGTLGDSSLSLRTLNAIRNPRIAAAVTADYGDVQILRSRFQSQLASFVLLNEEGLAELRQRDPDLRPLGQIDSAEMLCRQRDASGLYVWLALELISCTVALALAAESITAQITVSAAPETVRGPIVKAIVPVLCLIFLAVRTWDGILNKEPEQVAVFKVRHRRVLWITIWTMIASLTLGVVVGIRQGTKKAKEHPTASAVSHSTGGS